MCNTWVKRPADHARQDDEEHWEHFQVAGEDRRPFSVAQVFCRKRPLDDHLKRRTQYSSELFPLHSFISVHHARCT